MVETFIFAALGYLIGSIPFGLILTKFAGYGDIRAIGSGNIGATNVLRTGNKKLALATLLLDAIKGAAAVYLASHLAGRDCSTMNIICSTAHPNCDMGCRSPAFLMDIAMLTGFAAIIGHMFPVWLKFKGGKGVATTLGVLLALSRPTGITSCLIWLIMAVAFRYSSLAALVAILCAPLAAWIFTHNDTLAGTCAFIALLVWIKHRANLKRLLAGEEPKIGKAKT